MTTGTADYLVTGNFSKKAAEEAAKFGTARIAASSKDKNFTYIPDVKAIAYDPNASYIHICQNNTIFGTTYKDVPQKRFTLAGQTFPEPSPYDRLILDRRVRFVGDGVAIIAGETEEQVDHAMRLIKVKYRVLEPVLDPHEAKDGKILVHPEEDWKALCDVGQIIGEICALRL